MRNNPIYSVLALCYILLGLSGCKPASKANPTELHFIEFCKGFPEIHFPLTLNDSIALSSDIDKKKLIDTLLVKEYGLAKRYAKTNYPITELALNECCYIGRFSTKNYVGLLYRLSTSEAGNGGLRALLTTFTKAGTKIDEAEVLWEQVGDAMTVFNTNLMFADSVAFTVTETQVINGFLTDQIVPKSITRKIIDSRISAEGKISSEPPKIKQIFKDNNPEILDDLP